MSAHTPGPWKLCYDGQIDGADGAMVVALPFESYREFADLQEVERANYRAMTAAPELLAALLEVLKHAKWHAAMADEVTDEAKAAIKMSDAAIAKATGAAS
jgi:hypothetical protein